MNPSPSDLRSVPQQAAGALLWVALTAVAATLGAVASMSAGDFYLQLSRPDWAPPPSVFSPVWTVLYVLMAAAAVLYWRAAPWPRVRTGMALYLAQLVVNALWSWCFFAWHSGLWAFVDVIVLWLLIAATALAFWRLQRLAALLLLPYLAWVSFATALTWAVWQRNPALLG